MNDQTPQLSTGAIRLRLLASLIAFGLGVAAVIVAILLVRGTLGLIRRAFLAAVLIVATGAVAVPQALADGDPASDYLVDQQVFLTAQSTATTPAQRELVQEVAAANRAGYALRVAVIPTRYDLGSITVLWHKPSLYARFLGLELGACTRAGCSWSCRTGSASTGRTTRSRRATGCWPTSGWRRATLRWRPAPREPSAN